MNHKIELWHGSSHIIEKPLFGYGKPYNDYGLGFYCTESRELAKEWACTENQDGYANHYELEAAGLDVMNLSSGGYHVLHWLALLIDNRVFQPTAPIARQGIQYLKEYFLPDISRFDVIVGYRADDSYFSFARAFLNNTISLNQLAQAMRLGKLGEQFVLKSEKAFLQIHFIEYEAADAEVYYVKRKSRDEEARRAYREQAALDDLSGLYLRDIMREGVKADDLRLR
ncbi:MAG: DUF3990 domain-containing protein [Lachnospiraceae bacterium]|nr:DUF3990 domain-containing protein [Lachnospiraceae bacterium]